jgi:hypothetical protein
MSECPPQDIKRLFFLEGRYKEKIEYQRRRRENENDKDTKRWNENKRKKFVFFTNK